MSTTRPEPTTESRNNMEQLTSASKRKTGLQLPHSFLRSEDGLPPLLSLLRGGRSGEVRLKLYLTASLIAAARPHEYRRNTPARAWAELLNLPKPETAGARRVSDAFEWLDDHDYLRVDRRRGVPPKFTLLSMELDGEEYVKPAMEYVAIPLGLWTRHWINALSGTELAILLAILDLPGNDDHHSRQPRFATGEQKDRYGFSDDSWTRATKQLVHLGVLEVTRKVANGGMSQRRNRNIYRLTDPHLGNEPTWPITCWDSN
jgi:hypothetical protein